ncbi:MAG: response regulator transcription factor [Caldimonas sp.]
MHLLVVEDDAGLAEALRSTLQADHRVDCIADGFDADRLLHQQTFDLVILDLTLPGLDGVDVLRRLRERGSQTPVLILSARNANNERVRALNLGADDYLVKPATLDEFEARVRALLRRAGAFRSERTTVGRLAFDSALRSVTVDGQPIDLSNREVSVLEALLRHRGQIVSKERLMQLVYGVHDEIGSNTIEVYVHRLRKKLIGSGLTLRTSHGRGYALERDDARSRGV